MPKNDVKKPIPFRACPKKAKLRQATARNLHFVPSLVPIDAN